MPPHDVEEAEAFELAEDGNLLAQSKTDVRPPQYKDHSSIDWLYEEHAERARQQKLRSHRGVNGILMPFMDASRMWLVIVVTGFGIGVAGAWLDVLVKWCTPRSFKYLVTLLNLWSQACRPSRGQVYLWVIL